MYIYIYIYVSVRKFSCNNVCTPLYEFCVQLL